MRVCPFSQYEAKTKLESLSGNSSISSADLFGDGSDHKGKTRKGAEMQQMWLFSGLAGVDDPTHTWRHTLTHLCSLN